jgi:hypothetical protein
MHTYLHEPFVLLTGGNVAATKQNKTNINCNVTAQLVASRAVLSSTESVSQSVS